MFANNSGLNTQSVIEYIQGMENRLTELEAENQQLRERVMQLESNLDNTTFLTQTNTTLFKRPQFDDEASEKLMKAICWGRDEYEVGRWLGKKANPNYHAPVDEDNFRYQKGDTPLTILISSSASTKKKIKVADVLLKKGANINEPDESRGQTPLHRAMYKRDAELIKFLLDHNANPFITDAAEKTPKDLYHSLSAKEWRKEDERIFIELEHVEDEWKNKRMRVGK